MRTGKWWKCNNNAQTTNNLHFKDLTICVTVFKYRCIN